MPRKLVTFIFAFIVFFGIFSNKNTVLAACTFNYNNVFVNLATCVINNPTSPTQCKVCLDPMYVCNPSSECSAHSGIIGQLTSVTGMSLVCANPLIPAAASTESNSWYRPALCPFNEKISNTSNPQEIFGERYTFAQVSWITNSLIINLIDSLFDIIIVPLKNELGVATISTPLSPSLAVNLQPLSGVREITNTLDKFNLATPVFAQSFGEQSLDGLRELWSASRNMAYLIMVLLLVASGFLIMFRIKISAQAAVSLQMMIPKLILTLVLVTFSYAISGLIIDLVYVLINFIISITPTTLVVDPAAARKFFTGPSLPAIYLYYFINTLGTISDIATGGDIGKALLSIVFIIILIFLLAKVMWTLFKSYVSLLIQVVIGPWVIMIGLIPGVSTGFGSWFRTTIAHASVFVVVPLMFAFNMLLWGNSAGIGSLINLLQAIGIDPSVINNGLTTSSIGVLPNLPLLGGVGSLGFLFNTMLGFVILSLIPKAAEMIQAALKVSPFNYGSAIGEAIGGGAGLAGMAYNKAAEGGDAVRKDDLRIAEKRFKDATTPDDRKAALEEINRIESQGSRVQFGKDMIKRAQNIKT